MDKKISIKKCINVIVFWSAFYLLSGAQTAKIWVSPNGSDRAKGTLEQPMATLNMSLRKAREMRRLNDPSIKNGIEVILKEGVYNLYEPVYIRSEDSGSETSPTIIRSADGEKAVISGGKKVENWKKISEKIDRLPSEAQGKVWAVDIPSVWDQSLNFRELWVNGKKANRASSFNDGELDRIIKSDSLKEEMWIPVPKIALQHAAQLEFVIIQWWTVANLRVKSYKVIDNKVKLTFYQPESRVEFEHPWPIPIDDSSDIYKVDTKYPFCGNSPFYFANSLELLNQPGEWCRDVVSGKIYYWPKENEDMTKAEVIIPVLETVVHVEGSLDNPVKNIIFKNLSFEYTKWNRPSECGHIPVQDGMYMIDAYKLRPSGTPGNKSLENQGWLGRQPAGVSLKGACNITFKRCKFTHMAATGLDFIKGTNKCNVEGCILSDIGGSGIRIGFYGDLSIEDHIPYDPTDEREVCQNIRIDNNLVTNCSNEYWGCDGINVAFAHDINIEHNEVSYLNNSGISVGWGWTAVVNCMKNNRIHANNIHHFARQLYDVAGIYVLSAQPNTEISDNYIHDLEYAPYAHLKEHYQYIYLDQNSSYIRVLNNWTDKAKFNANANGYGNDWKNNGPQVDPNIKEKAGLEDGYKDLLNQ